jgi:hypothetical protein
VASQETTFLSESDSSGSAEKSSSTASISESRTQVHEIGGSDKVTMLSNPATRPIRQTASVSNATGSPPAVMTCAGLRATGLATPPVAPEPPSAADGYQTPASPVTHYTPSESFPVFQTGNVMIQCNLATPPKRWQLHSAMLERHSAWFRRAMHIDALNKQYFHHWLFLILEVHEGKIALVLQQARPRLHNDSNQDFAFQTAEHDQMVAITTPPASASGSTSSSESHQDDETKHAITIDIYNQVLGSFYSIPLLIPTDTMTSTLTFSESLVKTSHSLDCTPLISAQISTALHSHRQTLYTSVSSDPARWLLLSILLEDSAIYTEALIHIVGAHPCWPWPTKRHALPNEIVQLVVRKSVELDKLCMEVERELLLLTIHMHKSGPVEPHQHSHFDTWFVVQTFRDTLARTFHSLEQDRQGSLKRGALFRKIGKGGEEYMSAGEMRRLISRIMPSAVENLEEDLGMLKDVAKGVVKDVARNELIMDVEGQGVGYLTCVRIGKEDIPWKATGIEQDMD